uniref:Uncharacterized protein n=1 Tax=Trichogramma kaykai TaxID=54128 RepID=A0ABD2XGB1_9HYME
MTSLVGKFQNSYFILIKSILSDHELFNSIDRWRIVSLQSLEKYIAYIDSPIVHRSMFTLRYVDPTARLPLRDPKPDGQGGPAADCCDGLVLDGAPHSSNTMMLHDVDVPTLDDDVFQEASTSHLQLQMQEATTPAAMHQSPAIKTSGGGHLG